VSISWPKYTSECKSRLSAIARSCFLGRARWAQKFRVQQELLKELRDEASNSETRAEQLTQENTRLRKRIAELEAQLAQPQALELPLGEAPPGQRYGAGMITLCVNLARKIGLRPVTHVLSVFADWLGVNIAIPTYQSVGAFRPCRRN
jgi:hypothetical protein